MSEKKRRIIRILSLFFTIMLFFIMVVYADLIPDATPKLSGDVGSMPDKVNTMLSTIQYVGYAFAVGMLIWLGIRYTMAPANERAELKSGSIKYVIGAVIAFTAATLFPALYDEIATWVS